MRGPGTDPPRRCSSGGRGTALCRPCSWREGCVPVSDHGGRRNEARRYLEAAAGGLAIALVILVAAPQTSPTYLIAMGFFTVAIVLVWGDR